jgi:hypothetical protein
LKVSVTEEDGKESITITANEQVVAVASEDEQSGDVTIRIHPDRIERGVMVIDETGRCGEVVRRLNGVEPEEGDYVVRQREIHEQARIIPGGEAESRVEAARMVWEEGQGEEYGGPRYERTPQFQELEVSVKGVETGSLEDRYVDVEDL